MFGSVPFISYLRMVNYNYCVSISFGLNLNSVLRRDMYTASLMPQIYAELNWRITRVRLDY